MFPWLVHLSTGEGKKLSDLEYIAKKEFDGKVVTNEGVKTTTGTLATLTASSGKDMYVLKAKCMFSSDNVSGSSTLDKVELQLNGTVVETALFSYVGGTSGTFYFDYEFKNVGKKVIATEVIKLEVITLDADVTVEGFITCIEEPTGASPEST